MSSKKVIWIIVALLAAIAAVGYRQFNFPNAAFSEPSVPIVGDSSADVSGKVDPASDAGSAGTRTPAQSPSAAAVDPSSAIAMLNRGASVDEVLRSHGTKAGISDKDARSVYHLALGVCTGELDAFNSTSKDHADPTRVWAVDRLLSLCEGFKPDDYKFESTPEGPASLLSRLGPEAAASQAFNVVASARDWDSLMEAGQVLIQTGRLPIDKILPGGANNYGVPEQIGAWSVASSLASCEAAGGCGPNSLQTARFCASRGCAPGSTYQSAIQQRLPESDRRAAMAFYGWILAQRQ